MTRSRVEEPPKKKIRLHKEYSFEGTGNQDGLFCVMTINVRYVILFCFTMFFQLLLLNKLELDDRDL